MNWEIKNYQTGKFALCMKCNLPWEFHVTKKSVVFFGKVSGVEEHEEEYQKNIIICPELYEKRP